MTNLIAEAASLHSRLDGDTNVCARDDEDWPCLTTRLTAELAAANAVIAEVRSVATRERMIELAADALSEVTYTCSRTWEAWQYNTMTEDDFAPAWEDGELLASVVDSVLEALDGDKAAPVVDGRWVNGGALVHGGGLIFSGPNPNDQGKTATEGN